MICPKCGNKIEKEQVACRFCGLKVQNITQASNQKAKEILKNKGDTSSIVMSKTLPPDLKKSKLLLLSIFLGWTGAHCYYCGRLKRGFTILLLLLFCATFVSIPPTWFLHAYLSGIVAGIIGCIAWFMWWLDIARIIANKYPVPVVLNNY